MTVISDVSDGMLAQWWRIVRATNQRRGELKKPPQQYEPTCWCSGEFLVADILAAPSRQQIHDYHSVAIGKRREGSMHLKIGRLGSENFYDVQIMTFANSWNCRNPPWSQHRTSSGAIAKSKE